MNSRRKTMLFFCVSVNVEHPVCLFVIRTTDLKDPVLFNIPTLYALYTLYALCVLLYHIISYCNIIQQHCSTNIIKMLWWWKFYQIELGYHTLAHPARPDLSDLTTKELLQLRKLLNGEGQDTAKGTNPKQSGIWGKNWWLSITKTI